jgi:hypothetical protein
MSNRGRFLIGGVGGFAPVLMFLVTGDASLHSFVGSFTIAGLLLRAAVLFFIGGFVASLYPQESERMKVFQLGLGAPALLAGFLAQSPATPARPAPASFFAVVHAQTTANANEVKRFTLPAPTASQQFLQGFAGVRPQPKNVWFVIATSNPSLAAAQAAAKAINSGFRGFHAEVYAPYLDNPNYAVVIGAQLSESDASALAAKAASAGMGHGVKQYQPYYKTFPYLPFPASQ